MIMILIGIILAIKTDSYRVADEPIIKSDENREEYQLFLFIEIAAEICLFFLFVY